MLLSLAAALTRWLRGTGASRAVAVARRWARATHRYGHARPTDAGPYWRPAADRISKEFNAVLDALAVRATSVVVLLLLRLTSTADSLYHQDRPLAAPSLKAAVSLIDAGLCVRLFVCWASRAQPSSVRQPKRVRRRRKTSSICCRSRKRLSFSLARPTATRRRALPSGAPKRRRWRRSAN